MQVPVPLSPGDRERPKDSWVIDIPPLADAGVQSQSHLLVRLEQRSGTRGLGQGGSTLVSLSHINHVPIPDCIVNDICIQYRTR